MGYIRANKRKAVRSMQRQKTCGKLAVLLAMTEDVLEKRRFYAARHPICTRMSFSPVCPNAVLVRYNTTTNGSRDEDAEKKACVRCDCECSTSNASIELFDTGPVLLDDLANVTDLFELGLQLVDLAEYFVEASDLGISILDQSAGAIVLHGRG